MAERTHTQTARAQHGMWQGNNHCTGLSEKTGARLREEREYCVCRTMVTLLRPTLCLFALFSASFLKLLTEMPRQTSSFIFPEQMDFQALFGPHFSPFLLLFDCHPNAIKSRVTLENIFAIVMFLQE